MIPLFAGEPLAFPQGPLGIPKPPFNNPHNLKSKSPHAPRLLHMIVWKMLIYLK